MRSLHLLSVAVLLFLIACSDVQKSDDTIFRKAINQYLA